METAQADKVFLLPLDDMREEGGTAYHILISLPCLPYCLNRDGAMTYISQTHCSPASLTCQKKVLTAHKDTSDCGFDCVYTVRPNQYLN